MTVIDLRNDFTLPPALPLRIISAKVAADPANGKSRTAEPYGKSSSMGMERISHP